jgi:hypothetical protein
MIKKILLEEIIFQILLHLRINCSTSTISKTRIVAISKIHFAIKVSSWKWWMSRATAAHCSRYQLLVHKDDK